MKCTREGATVYLFIIIAFISPPLTQTINKHSEDKCPHCECAGVPPACPRGVPIVMDGCGCCPICARQQGDACDSIQLCDPTRQLKCVYHNPTANIGICKVKQGRSCFVAGRIYQDGETFKLDCRTQCTCQNGTYGCVSLCPHENIRPSGNCRNPQLVPLRSACCREWLCETSVWEHKEPDCDRYSSDWSPCSVTCGVGSSSRVTNHNPECQMRTESRICQIRPCEVLKEENWSPTLGHHTRRNHLCRATIKSTLPVRITDDKNCSSVKLYEPKFCGYCDSRRCCQPQLSTTVKMAFYCFSDNDDDDDEIEDESHHLVTKDYMWIVKCVCDDNC